MKIDNFEDLEIWKNAREITGQTYIDFESLRDFGFKDQIQRCAVSIMNNIAEGFCRETTKEKLNFLNIAKGSAGELKSMYYIAQDLNYLPETTANERRKKIQGVANGIGALRKYLKNYLNK